MRSARPTPAGAWCAAAVAVLLWPPAAAAQTESNVLVVVNEDSAESREIADYYVRRRAIPGDQVLRLRLPVTDDIDRPAYEAQIELPVARWIRDRSAYDRILYLVLTKGVPLRISGTQGESGTVASVDSELTLLYRKLAGTPSPHAGPLPNPYYLADAPIRDAQPFTHERHDIYLVTRLDGFGVADVKALIDRGMTPSREGEIVLDGRAETGAPASGNGWLEKAASAMQGLSGWSERVVLDTTFRPVGAGVRSLGYYSWGSNDTTHQIMGLPKLDFAPGALAAMFVSTDGRTFRQPPYGWKPGDRDFAGSNQSLTGELIQQGVTGTAGHVAEPYLPAAILPDVLFPVYVSGLNLAESFYSGMPFLSWQTVVIGDPLVAPFRQTPLGRSAIDPGLDTTSELPRFMTEHRLRAPARGSLNAEGLKLLMRAEVRTARGDRSGAQDALERATAIDERLVAGHFALALMYDSLRQWDAAIDRYRRILSQTPDNAVALNNLAYAIAVRKKAPAEALPLAQRAYTLSKGLPDIADTLAWIHHLLGQDERALPLITEAAERAPRNADIQLHAAVILAATGAAGPAAAALGKAVSINPALLDRDDVRLLQLRLGSQ